MQVQVQVGSSSGSGSGPESGSGLASGAVRGRKLEVFLRAARQMSFRLWQRGLSALLAQPSFERGIRLVMRSIRADATKGNIYMRKHKLHVAEVVNLFCLLLILREFNVSPFGQVWTRMNPYGPTSLDRE